MLYNIKKSFATHHIHEDGHKIYFEEYGKKNGIPILFLHGGPGSGCNPSQRSLFNSEKFRISAFFHGPSENAQACSFRPGGMESDSSGNH